MNMLLETSAKKIHSANTEFSRYLLNKIDWNNRLLAITGARGVGKTTLLLQYLKKNIPDISEALYASADDFYFTNHRLADFADDFVKNGGKHLFIDEVHKYPGWSTEIKNIYDNHRELKIVFTGSSALEIFKGQADLSRRVLIYTLHGLSLREYIALNHHIKFPAFSLEDIIENSSKISSEISKKIKPLKLFHEYLEHGYYPFYLEDKKNYLQRIVQTITYVLETDLPASFGIDFHSVHKLKKILGIIAEIVPFKPNILKLSQQAGVTRETLLRYLYYLAKAQIINMLSHDAYGTSILNKPEKIYLNNSNLIYALAGQALNKGTLRETFFYNQLQQQYPISYSEKGDFLVDKKYVFEIGGKNKTSQQISGVKNSYLALDDIELAHRNIIPIWLFGFLY